MLTLDHVADRDGGKAHARLLWAVGGRRRGAVAERAHQHHVVLATVDQLAGTWKLQSLQPAGDVAQTTPAGASYTLTFADGRLSTRADCTVCGGPFALSGQTLTAGPTLACTRAACPTMAFESTYTRLLSGDSTVTLSDGALVLSSVRGVLHFTR